MEGRAKVTKEVLCEEARFILANVMAEARYGRQNRYDDIRRVCEGAVSIPFQEYIGFLEKSGYLRHDRAGESLEVTPEGEAVVNGGNLTEFTERAVSHFKKLRQSRAMAAVSTTGGVPLGTQTGVVSAGVQREASGAAPLPRKEAPKMTGSGGRPSAPGRLEPRGRAEGDPRSVRVLQRGPAQRDRAAVHRGRARVGQPRAPEHPADPRRQPLHRVSEPRDRARAERLVPAPDQRRRGDPRRAGL